METVLAHSADEWEQLVSKLFVPLNCVPFAPSFHGRMRHERLDETVAFSRAVTAGKIIDRTSRLAARADTDDLHISFQLSAPGLISQGAATVPVGAGSTTIYATDRPYHLDYSAPHQDQLIVQISRASLGLERSVVRELQHHLRLETGRAARTLRRFAWSRLHSGPVAPMTRGEETAAVTRDLTCALIRESAGSGSPLPRTDTGLRLTIEESLRALVDADTVDMDEIAAAHFVSRRRLYEIFESSGVGPSQFLRTERLRLAAARLRDPEWSRNPISEIAAASGFVDPTTFARAFRRVYGVSPRSWRSGATGIRTINAA